MHSSPAEDFLALLERFLCLRAVDFLFLPSESLSDSKLIYVNLARLFLGFDAWFWLGGAQEAVFGALESMFEESDCLLLPG